MYAKLHLLISSGFDFRQIGSFPPISWQLSWTMYSRLNIIAMWTSIGLNYVVLVFNSTWDQIKSVKYTEQVFWARFEVGLKWNTLIQTSIMPNLVLLRELTQFFHTSTGYIGKLINAKDDAIESRTKIEKFL